MQSNFEREELIFDAAIAIEDSSRRRAYLDEACGGDAAFRSRIERLLAVHDGADSFFIGCVAGLRTVLDEKEVAQLTDNAADEQLGRRVGNYKLLQKIGEGGCGVVYMAEQEKPVRRRVALKIIKQGMDTKQVIARFEAERQAVALMDHPNIAKVLDVGATETGRPYFVMELVHGVKITTFCDERNLDTQHRLDLFIQVCRAIQHAHQKGVIHRDIKPSNILVTLHDGVPVPKVIDFGIAKATETPLTDKTLFTVYGHFVGTPAYMSPEQAEMSGLDVDTRSDIYSLGVLLYELLTGRTPFDQDELIKAGFDEMRRTLREKEPHRPSTKLDTIPQAELTATALHRHAEPPKLQSLLRGDLDWVVMKSLEKDRARRYETANALAMDIQRYLNDEPVLARPPSRLYRFQKLVRRNRGIFAATGAVALALILGMATSTWLFFRERDARNRAVAAEQQQLRMRQAAETKEKITQVATLISRERFAEADELMKGVQLPGSTLDGALVFRSLAEWHALRREWTNAADRYAALIKADQLDGWNIESMDYLGAGAALLALTNRPGYDELRETALSRFANTENPVVAERMLKIGLLKPGSPHVIERLAGFAKVAAPESPVNLTAQSPAATAWQKSASGSISADSRSVANSGNPLADTTAPALVQASSYDGWTVSLEFSEPVAASGATAPASYSVAGNAVTNAILDAEGRTVVLSLAKRIAEEFSVNVAGISDLAGNPLPPGSAIGNRVLALRLLDFNTGQPIRMGFNGNVISLEAGGANIWESLDQFGFAYITVSGDFDYRLRVHSIGPMLDNFTRVGLMARESLQDQSGRHVTVAVNAENSFQVLVRTTVGGRTASLPPDPLPTAFKSNSWVRLQRIGPVFRAYSSSDGMDWVSLFQFDSASAGGAFSDPIHLGIVVSAHSSSALATAVVSGFGTTPTIPVNATVAFALLEYRRGDYESAVEWCRRSLAHPEYNAARVAMARTIMAMGLRQSGDRVAAQSQLNQSREMIQRKFSGGLDLGSEAHGFWFDWVFARTLLQEAETLFSDEARVSK